MTARCAPSQRVGHPLGEWAEQAACTGSPWEVFFGPEFGEPHGLTVAQQRRQKELEAEAKAICARCPVHVDCLAHAVENNERYGIWGGRTPTERAKLRAVRKGRVR